MLDYYYQAGVIQLQKHFSFELNQFYSFTSTWSLRQPYSFTSKLALRDKNVKLLLQLDHLPRSRLKKSTEGYFCNIVIKQSEIVPQFHFVSYVFLDMYFLEFSESERLKNMMTMLTLKNYQNATCIWCISSNY